MCPGPTELLPARGCCGSAPQGTTGCILTYLGTPPHAMGRSYLKHLQDVWECDQFPKWIPLSHFWGTQCHFQTSARAAQTAALFLLAATRRVGMRRAWDTHSHWHIRAGSCKSACQPASHHATKQLGLLFLATATALPPFSHSKHRKKKKNKRQGWRQAGTTLLGTAPLCAASFLGS